MPKVCPVCDATYPDANAFCPVDGTTLHVVDLEGGLIGSVIADRYLVTDLLGEGGMGKVYLARHVRLPQQAAIKVLRPDMVRDPAAIARFNREASNASRIDDENVARVYDFGEAAGGSVYLAMEYVPGRTLKDLIASEGALPPRRAADLVRQIARGLDAAHRLKIIHRDLKPDNVLVTTGQDGHDRVKVVDFGIAKAFGAEGGNLTKTGFVVGTPEFMSPEQLLGTPLDARSDVYALALVAFQCLTASLPFGADTPEQAMTARLTSPPLRLIDLSPAMNWPPPVQEVFDAALSRDVFRRPESAGEFARRLAAAIDEWAPGGATVKAPPPHVPSPRKSVEPPPTPKPRRWPILVGLVVVLAAGAASVALWRRNSASVSTAAIDSLAGATSGAPPATPAAGDTGGKAAQIAASPSPPPSDSRSAGRVPLPKTATPNVPEKTSSRDTTVSTADARPPAASPETRMLRETLDSLSTVLGGRSVDAATAAAAARVLRSIAPRMGDSADRTRAYLRLIDASALSGDMPGACAAFRAAQTSARTPAQIADVRKYDEQLGCA